MESLPAEMQTQVMLRLPLNYLLTIGIYVCKSWKSIICSVYFKTLFLERSLLSMPRDIDPAPDSWFHSICSGNRLYTVSAPIRGWICVKSGTKWRLYNRITHKSLHLTVGGGRSPDTCFFGYDEVTRVFKVLAYIDSRFEVYTVRSGGGEGSWRPIACEHPHRYVTPFRDIDLNWPTPLSLSATNALCKGGVLYYAATRSLPDLSLAPIVMSFDLNSETFDYNQLPEGFIVGYDSTMVNYNGKVALVMSNAATELQNTGGFQICVRNEDSGQWELERVVIPGWRTFIWSFLSLVDGTIRTKFYFVGTIGSGELVFVAVATSVGGWEYVLFYDPGSRTKRGPFLLKGANKGAYHYLRACLNHFECLFRTT